MKTAKPAGSRRSVLASYLAWRYSTFREKLVDWFYSIDTGGTESAYLDSGKFSSARHAVPYEAVQHTVFHRLIRNLEVHAGPLERYVFIDLGSGKGRALIYAAGYSFKAFAGVEFGDGLHRVAEHNIRGFRDRTGDARRFGLHNMDVLDYRLPDDDLVVFLYNPFTGPVMQSVTDSLCDFGDRGPHKLYIAYRNPTCLAMFDRPCFQLLESNSSYAIIRHKNNSQ